MRYTIRNSNLVSGQIESVILYPERKFFPNTITPGFKYSDLKLDPESKSSTKKLSRVSLGQGLVNRYLYSGFNHLEDEYDVSGDIVLNRLKDKALPEDLKNPDIIERTLLPTKHRHEDGEIDIKYFGESRLGNQYIYAIPIPPGIGVAEVYTTRDSRKDEEEQKYFELTGKTRLGPGPIVSVYFGPGPEVLNNPDSRYYTVPEKGTRKELDKLEYIKQSAELRCHKILWLVSSPEQTLKIDLVTKAWNISDYPHDGEKTGYIRNNFKTAVYNRFDWIRGEFVDRASGTVIGNKVESNIGYKILSKKLEFMNDFDLGYKYIPGDICKFKGSEFKCIAKCIGEYPDVSNSWTLNGESRENELETMAVLQYDSPDVNSELVYNKIDSSGKIVIKSRNAYIITGVYKNLKDPGNIVGQDQYTVKRDDSDTVWIVTFTNRQEITKDAKVIVFCMAHEEGESAGFTLKDTGNFDYIAGTDPESLDFRVIEIKDGETEVTSSAVKDGKVLDFSLSVSDKYYIESISQVYKGKREGLGFSKFGDRWEFRSKPLYKGENNIIITKGIRDYNVYLDYSNLSGVDVSSYQETTKYGGSVRFLINSSRKIKKVTIKDELKETGTVISLSLKAYPEEDGGGFEKNLESGVGLLSITKHGSEYLYNLELTGIKRNTTIRIDEDRQ